MRLYARRRLLNSFNLAASMLTMAFGLFWLGWILWTLVAAGFGALSSALFTQMTPPPGSRTTMSGRSLVSGSSVWTCSEKSQCSVMPPRRTR